MSVVLRLSRRGKRGLRIYRIVAMEKRTKANAAPLEVIGFYEDKAGSKDAKNLRIDQKRLAYWQSVGAQMTPAIKKLIAA